MDPIRAVTADAHHRQSATAGGYRNRLRPRHHWHDERLIVLAEREILPVGRDAVVGHEVSLGMGALCLTIQIAADQFFARHEKYPVAACAKLRVRSVARDARRFAAGCGDPVNAGFG